MISDFNFSCKVRVQAVVKLAVPLCGKCSKWEFSGAEPRNVLMC